MATTPNIRPSTGKTIQKTTTTTILPAAAETTKPEFWQYYESLPARWGEPPDRHCVYIYRRVNETGPMTPLEKLVTPIIQMPDRTQLSINTREDLEFALATKYGGGAYRLILKRGGERVAEGFIKTDGPQKSTPPAVSQGDVAPIPATQYAPPGDVATTAMNLMARQPNESIDVAVRALGAAGDMVQRIANKTGDGSGSPARSEMDELTRQFMLVMMQRMAAPAPDPLEMLTKLLAVMQGLNTATNPTAAANPVISKIFDAALDRFMNPIPSGPAVSTGAELVRTLPQLGGYATEALREWRVGMEAQRDIAAMQARPAPGALPGSATILPAPRANVVPAAAASQAAAVPVRQSPAPALAPGQSQSPAGAQPAIAQPSLEFIEAKLVEIFRAPISADEAADNAIAFLDVAAPELLEQLKAFDEANLMGLFQTRPVLKPATANLGRLTEFIAAFVRYLREDEAARASSPGAPDSVTVEAQPVKKPN